MSNFTNFTWPSQHIPYVQFVTCRHHGDLANKCFFYQKQQFIDRELKEHVKDKESFPLDTIL